MLKNHILIWQSFFCVYNEPIVFFFQILLLRYSYLQIHVHTCLIFGFPRMIVKKYKNKSLYNLSYSKYVLEQLIMVSERMYHIEVSLIPYCAKALIQKKDVN